VKKRTLAHLAALSTNLFFAVNYSLIKIIAPALVKPFALNVLRAGFSLLLFWVVWVFEKKRVPIQKQHWMRLVWCGITGIAINQMLFIKGLTLTSAVHASLLVLATPLLISVFALLVLKEPLTRFKIIGLVLGVCGSVLLVATKENGIHAQNHLLGDLLILTNASFYAVYFILVKPLMHVYSPMQVIRWVFTFGFVLMLPFGWRELQQVQWPQFDTKDYLCLFSVIITGTFLAYLFTAYGLHHLGAGTTGAYIYTQPVFAVIVATVFIGETLSWTKVAAAALIFFGVYLVNQKRVPI
jgi:drug/metabolite transporter (DMT)-like permease